MIAKLTEILQLSGDARSASFFFGCKEAEVYLSFVDVDISVTLTAKPSVTGSARVAVVLRAGGGPKIGNLIVRDVSINVVEYWRQDPMNIKPCQSMGLVSPPLDLNSDIAVGVERPSAAAGVYATSALTPVKMAGVG